MTDTYKNSFTYDQGMQINLNFLVLSLVCSMFVIVLD